MTLATGENVKRESPHNFVFRQSRFRRRRIHFRSALVGSSGRRLDELDLCDDAPVFLVCRRVQNILYIIED
jgi:hypothetical protein